MARIGFSSAPGVKTHAQLTDVNTPHLLAELENAVCSETEAAALVTKEVFTPLFGVMPAEAATIFRGGWIHEAGNRALLMILVPHDFTSITSLEIILDPQATGADMHCEVHTYFGAYAGGEAYNTGSEHDTDRDIGATVENNNLAHDISDLVTGLAAGDLLLVYLSYKATVVATNAYIKGIRLKYA